MTAESKDALIIFSRLPIGRETKTRLAPVLSEHQREELHLAMWQDIFPEILKLTKRLDVFLYWTGSGDVKDYMKFIPSEFHLAEQNGKNLGSRMSNAIRDIINLGYKKVIVTGSDIPLLKAENISRALEALGYSDVVIGPSTDGGYWLIGMKKFMPEVFDIEAWGKSNVLQTTIKKLLALGLRYELADSLQDIDTLEDAVEFMKLGCNKKSYVHKYLSKVLLYKNSY